MSEVIEKKKAVRKKTALALHRDGECGCSILSNPNNCIYQQFLDGWEFTPDVGNGQKRGEVFTPRFIVSKMISDVGLIPAAAVDEQNYTTVDKEEALNIVSSKVLEPAVGTGNYISTVLWHKLEYAFVASLGEDNTLNLAEYHRNVLRAVSSIYVFDIDPGNLETTFRRLLNYTDVALNDSTSVEKWVENLKTSLTKESMKQTTVKNIRQIVKESLNLAEQNWNKFINSSSQGVIQQLYTKHTGESIPEELSNYCLNILEENIKLFNGIVKEDTVQEGFVVAGWENVVWKWWNVNDETTFENFDNILLDYEEVPLKAQMLQGEIETLERRAEHLKNTKMIEKDDGLFSVLDWADKASEIEYNKLTKQIAKLTKQLSVM